MKPWKKPDGLTVMVTESVRKTEPKASFELYYSSDAPERQAIAVSVSEQAKEMGIEVKAIGSNWDEMDGVKNSQAIVWGFGVLTRQQSGQNTTVLRQVLDTITHHM